MLMFCPLMAPAPANAAPIPHFNNGQVLASTRDHVNRLHVLWVEQSAANQFRLLYQLQTLSGSPIGPAVLIQESQHRLRRPHLMFDAREGVIHALWQERFAKSAGARNAEGTWVHYARLSSGQEGPAVLRQAILNKRPLAQHPDLAVDRHGAAYAVWEEDADAIRLAKIVGDRPVESTQIATRLSRRGQGFPALTIDDQGDLHLAWSAVTPIGTQQIVYVSLSHHDFNAGRLAAMHAVYTAGSPTDQPKQIRIDDRTGRITIQWKNQRQQGALGRLAASANSVSFTTGPGSPGLVEQLVVSDTFVAPAAAANHATMPVAVTGKRLSVKPVPMMAMAPMASDDGPMSARVSRHSDAIGKLKLARLLAFTSWTGAPPAGKVAVLFSSPARSGDSISSVSRPSGFLQSTFPRSDPSMWSRRSGSNVMRHGSSMGSSLMRFNRSTI